MDMEEKVKIMESLIEKYDDPIELTKALGIDPDAPPYTLPWEPKPATREDDMLLLLKIKYDLRRYEENNR